jgi:hypothetical protein
MERRYSTSNTEKCTENVAELNVEILRGRKSRDAEQTAHLKYLQNLYLLGMMKTMSMRFYFRQT